MNRIIRVIIRMLAPSISFLVFYYISGLQSAIIVSCIVGFLLLLWDGCKGKRVNNSNIIGVLALGFQMISSFCIGYEKIYYVPALVQNCTVMIVISYLCCKSKSIFLYVVKDFDFAIFRNVKDDDILSLNYLWIAYCLLKIISKVLGIYALDFFSLYWLVFFFGTPLNILLIVLSYLYVKKKIEVNGANLE